MLDKCFPLAPIRLTVTEHQAEVKCCPHCLSLNRGEFPKDVNSVVQYGANLKGLMVYLLDYQLLPSARVEELFVDVLGCEISEGTLYASRERCSAELANVEALIQEQIAASEVIHCDETGMRLNGNLWWLHVASTNALTFYFVHAQRGKVAMDAMEILPQYQGISVHDGLRSYAQYDCDHALCNAHHLREKRIYHRTLSPNLGSPDGLLAAGDQTACRPSQSTGEYHASRGNALSPSSHAIAP